MKTNVNSIALLVLLIIHFTLAGCNDTNSQNNPESPDEAHEKSPNIESIWKFNFRIPSGWEVVSGSDAKPVRRQVEEGTKQMLASLGADNGSIAGKFGLDEFKAIRMSNQAGWCIATTMLIPDQVDYLATMEKEQIQKIEWAKRQGIVERLYSSGKTQIGGVEMLQVDAGMRQGGRSNSYYYWSQSQPDLVFTLAFTVNTGQYDSQKENIQHLVESLSLVE